MKKKSRIRAGLSVGIFMAVFTILENFITDDNQTTNQILKSIISGVVTGALSGLLFGWLIGFFVKFLTQTIKIDTEPGEKILFETGANHFMGIEGVGGKLYLTDKRLAFKSHKLNIQKHQLSINLTDIEQVGRYKTLGIVNNGLSVTTVNGTTEKFVVEEVENWLIHLAEKNSLQRAAF